MMSILDPDEEDILRELEEEFGYSSPKPPQDAGRRAGQELVNSSEARNRLSGLAGGRFSSDSDATPAAASAPAMNTGWNDLAETQTQSPAAEHGKSKPPPEKRGQGGFFGRMFGGSKAAMVRAPDKLASTNKAPAAFNAVAAGDAQARFLAMCFSLFGLTNSEEQVRFPSILEVFAPQTQHANLRTVRQHK